jgi:hypothetical protein
MWINLCTNWVKELYKKLRKNIKALPKLLQTKIHQAWSQRQHIYKVVVDSRFIIVATFICKSLWISIKSAWGFSLFVTTVFALAQGLILSIDKASEARVMSMATDVLIMAWNYFWAFILIGIVMTGIVAIVKFRKGIIRSNQEKITLQAVKSNIEGINARLDKIEKLIGKSQP